jgi:hypothetical protein
LRESLWAWVKTNGEPRACRARARNEKLWLIKKGGTYNHACGARREDDLDRFRRVHAARYLKWCGNETRDCADCREILWRAGPCAVKVHKVNQRGAVVHKVTCDSCRLIRWCANASGRTGPKDNSRATLLEINRGDDAHQNASA